MANRKVVDILKNCIIILITFILFFYVTHRNDANVVSQSKIIINNKNAFNFKCTKLDENHDLIEFDYEGQRRVYIEGIGKIAQVGSFSIHQ